MFLPPNLHCLLLLIEIKETRPKRKAVGPVWQWAWACSSSYTFGSQITPKENKGSSLIKTPASTYNFQPQLCHYPYSPLPLTHRKKENTDP